MAKKTSVKCDIRGIVARIEQVGDRCVKGISTELKKYAELICVTAKANSPRDKGILESAIRVDPMRNGLNGRLWMKIYIDPTVAYPSKSGSPSRKTVGDYAWLMERFLTPHGTGGRWHARAGTLKKGSQAGGRFLERAIKQYKAALINRANEIVKRAVK